MRLLRLHRLGDLGALHDAWAGWTLHARTGELISPNGYRFEPGKLALWPLLCEQARFWRQDFARRTAGGCGGEAPARRSRPALDLSTLQGAVTLVGPRPAPESASSMPARRSCRLPKRMALNPIRKSSVSALMAALRRLPCRLMSGRFQGAAAFKRGFLAFGDKKQKGRLAAPRAFCGEK